MYRLNKYPSQYTTERYRSALAGLYFTCLTLVSMFYSVSSMAVADKHAAQPVYNFSSNVIANNLYFPKALLQLPDSRWLVAERDGTIVTVYATKFNASTDSRQNQNNTRQTLALPQLYQKGQGGLLHMALAADFTTTKIILFSYSKGTDHDNRLAVMRGVLNDDGLISDLTPVIELKNGKATPVHFGGKLLALSDGTWLLTTGDGFDYREQAQVLTSQLGKVLRFTLTGEPVSNPPFNDAPFIYTIGHRNPQGLVKTPGGDIYLHEHGPAGGDELNLLKIGQNYGWPVVTLGKDYSGATISPFDHYKGMVNPLVDWTPSIAPSSMAVYNNTLFTDLEGHLLVTALKAKALYAIDLSHSPLVARRIFPHIDKRFRDVGVGSDGGIYLLTDGEAAQVIQIMTSPTNPLSAEIK